MEDPNKKPMSAGKNESKERLDERKSDATSDETLSDIEGTESESSSASSKRDSGPSPDGLVDRRDEIKDAGPM